MTSREGLKLQGKTALVTGASSGLGQRFALVLARAGARVALAARRSEKLAKLAEEISAFDGRAIPIRLDVTDPASVRTAVEEAETELGPIDILINNSGVSVQKRLSDITPADYDQVMNTNAKGAFFVAQEVAKRMIARGTKGRIVNIASVAGLRPLSQLSVYSMSKAAVVQMTRAMALEWGRHGININAICPGYIETEMNRDYWPTDAGKKMISMLPRRRVGQPEHLDGMLMLLVGPDSDFINGAIIPVDDGQTAA